MQTLLITRGGPPQHKDGTTGDGSGNYEHQKKSILSPAIAATSHYQTNYAQWATNSEYDEEPKTIENQDRNIKKFLPQMHVVIRRSENSIENFAKNGRLGTQHELTQEDANKSRGFYDPGLRGDIEHAALGVPYDAKPEDRPVYGYLRTDAMDNFHVNGYGYMQIWLKESAKSRVYVTGGDSLGAMENITVLPMQLNQADHRILTPTYASAYDRNESGEGAIRSADDMVNYGIGYYLEAQITGGVKLDDVAKIIFNNPDYTTERPTMYDGKIRPNNAEMSVYNAHGIQVVDERGKDWNQILKERATY